MYTINWQNYINIRNRSVLSYLPHLEGVGVSIVFISHPPTHPFTSIRTHSDEQPFPHIYWWNTAVHYPQKGHGSQVDHKLARHWRKSSSSISKDSSLNSASTHVFRLLTQWWAILWSYTPLSFQFHVEILLISLKLKQKILFSVRATYRLHHLHYVSLCSYT